MHIIIGIVAGGLAVWFAKEDVSWALGYIAYLIVVFGIENKVANNAR